MKANRPFCKRRIVLAKKGKTAIKGKAKRRVKARTTKGEEKGGTAKICRESKTKKRKPRMLKRESQKRM